MGAGGTILQSLKENHWEVMSRMEPWCKISACGVAREWTGYGHVSTVVERIITCVRKGIGRDGVPWTYWWGMSYLVHLANNWVIQAIIISAEARHRGIFFWFLSCNDTKGKSPSAYCTGTASGLLWKSFAQLSSPDGLFGQIRNYRHWDRRKEIFVFSILSPVVPFRLIVEGHVQ